MLHARLPGKLETNFQVVWCGFCPTVGFIDVVPNVLPL